MAFVRGHNSAHLARSKPMPGQQTLPFGQGLRRAWIIVTLFAVLNNSPASRLFHRSRLTPRKGSRILERLWRTGKAHSCPLQHIFGNRQSFVVGCKTDDRSAMV
jgi:hypothetical protein